MPGGGLEGLGILSVHHNTLNGNMKLLDLHGLSTSSTVLFVPGCVSPSRITFENDAAVTVELSVQRDYLSRSCWVFLLRRRALPRENPGPGRRSPAGSRRAPERPPPPRTAAAYTRPDPGFRLRSLALSRAGAGAGAAASEEEGAGAGEGR